MITRRQFFKGCVGAIAAVSGLSLFAEYTTLDKLINSVPVLLYHRVGKEPDALTISVKRFHDDMEFISRTGYNTLSLEQIKQHLTGDSSGMPERPIVITFDDGYLDNYTNVFPILQKYSLNACFFIITGMLGQSERMTTAQIREMSACGMDFGSHTVTHRLLGELNDKEALAELKGSKGNLEQLLGKAVDFIAYPCGSYTADTLKLVCETGYSGGFSIRPGFAMFDNRLTIKRMAIFRFDRPIASTLMRRGLLPDMFGQMSRLIRMV